ncbi:MAG: hypothetical protein M1833_002148, partial [Piccolia ochrophora]
TDGGRDVDGQVVRSAVLEGDEDWWEADAAAAAAAAAPAAGAEEDQQGEEDGNEWLGTRVGVENVRKLWAAHVEDADVRLSTAAGRWLCEFIYYRSLRHFRDARHTDVVFLHVPAEVGEVELERGRRVTAGLVRALVEERRNARGVEGGR